MVRNKSHIISNISQRCVAWNSSRMEIKEIINNVY